MHRQARQDLLHRLLSWLDQPMAFLAIGWSIIALLELTYPNAPWVMGLFRLDIVIWILFALQFALGFIVAPDRLDFLRHNWLIGASVIFPSLRVVRLGQALLALRSVSFLGMLLRVDYATRAIGRIFSERKFGYLATLAAIVALSSAAAVVYFEQAFPQSPLRDFGPALWWSSTLITTINVGAEPISLGGRILAFILRLFALSISGYIAASLAAFLITQRSTAESDEASAQAAEAREAAARLEDIEGRLEQIEVLLTKMLDSR